MIYQELSPMVTQTDDHDLLAVINFMYSSTIISGEKSVK